MVTGQYAQSAGEKRQAFVQPKLHRKISDGVGAGRFTGLLLLGVAPPVLEERFNPLQMGQITIILCQLLKSLLRYYCKKRDRIALHGRRHPRFERKNSLVFIQPR